MLYAARMPNDKVAGTPGMKRVTINLVPKSAQALARLMRFEQLSQSDAINVAIQRYEKIRDMSGGTVFIPGADGTLREVILV